MIELKKIKPQYPFIDLTYRHIWRLYMMFMHDIHSLEPWIETNFQCMTLDGIDAS